jgi:hypothetical protein
MKRQQQLLFLFSQVASFQNNVLHKYKEAHKNSEVQLNAKGTNDDNDSC